LTHSNTFENLILFVIVLNTVTMALDSYNQSEWKKETLKLANTIFAIIFNIEMIFKLISDGTKYFSVGWNLFDMFIVITADISMILQILGTGSD
jgi:hypothetical protein